MANIKNILGNQLEQIKQDGTYKHERIIQTPQETEIDVLGETVINFCANNYLGLSNDIAIKKAAIQAIVNFTEKKILFFTLHALMLMADYLKLSSRKKMLYFLMN